MFRMVRLNEPSLVDKLGPEIKMSSTNKPANSARKSRGSSRKNGNSNSAPKQKKKTQRPRGPSGMMPAAMNDANAARFIGMDDLEAHKVSWIAGSVYVGNGTNGATDSVYFSSNTSGLVPGTSGGGQVPILGSDAGVGKSYVSDIEKYYARKVIRKLKVRLLSVQPSTANSMVALIAPVRGPAASGDTVTFTAATTAAPAYSNVVGMTGVKSVPSYKDAVLDMTPYIAGGSGPKQNEFSINRDGDTSGTAWGAGTLDLVGIAPAAFVISGVNGTTGLRGGITHYVVIETVADYLDFLGGMSNPNPLSFATKLNPKEAEICLRALLTSPGKEVRDFEFVRALVRWLEDHKPSPSSSLTL